MSKSYAMKKKEQIKLIEELKKEFKQNQEIYEFNLELFKKKAELEQANLKVFSNNQRKHELNSKIIDIEIAKCNIENPIFEFHRDKEWLEAFKELKKFESEMIELEWETAQKHFETQKNKIHTFQFAGVNTTEEKLREQNQRIEERNPEIIEKLKNFGINLSLSKEVTQDYIG